MIQKAFEDCKQNNCDLYIFVGSADKKGTPRNPLPIDFRMKLIEGSLLENFSIAELVHIYVYPLSDLTDEADNSYDWGRYLLYSILYKTQDPDITIYYSDKPEIMLSWFDAEDRAMLRFKFLDRYQGISATKVRDMLINDVTDEEILEVVPNFVFTHLKEIKKYILLSRGLEE
jgi:hypothetical protein